MKQDTVSGLLTCFLLAGNVFAQSRTVTVTDVDNNTQVNLNVGDDLAIQLTSTASTGYSWTVFENNNSLLRPITVKAEPNYRGMPGAPGKQVLSFRALRSGGGNVKLIYRRPGDKNTQTGKQFRIRVAIKPYGDGSQGKTITVGDSDNKGKVTLNLGDTLIVELKSNPSTGYKWWVARNNSSLLEPVDHASRPGQSGLIGVHGIQIFKFKAVGPGDEEYLALLYQRSWESAGIKAAQKFELTVIINRSQ